MSGYLCLNVGDPQECQCCGGWIHAGDPPEVPVGEPAIDGKYCSTDCHDSMTRFIEARYREARER